MVFAVNTYYYNFLNKVKKNSIRNIRETCKILLKPGLHLAHTDRLHDKKFVMLNVFS